MKDGQSQQRLRNQAMLVTGLVVLDTEMVAA